MRNRTMLAALLLASLAVAAAEPPGTIAVNGEAMECVAPDEVQIGFGVETFHAALDGAKKENDAACARLMKAIKDLGVEEKNIQTNVMEVELKYRNNNHPSEGIEGYFVRKAYTVTLKDTKKFEPLVDAALRNGANRLMNFEFRTTELRKYRDAARKKAILAARDKAKDLAEALGQRVGRARTINEGSFGYFGAFRSWWGGWGGGQNQWSQNYASHGGGEGAGGETVALGEIGIRAQVHVTFELLDGDDEKAAAEPNKNE